MKLAAEGWKKVEAHFKRPCELNERNEIVYRDQNFPVGYIAEGDFEGYLVDSTGDRDELIAKVA